MVELGKEEKVVLDTKVLLVEMGMMEMMGKMDNYNQLNGMKMNF
jgi:hypothetical protein